MVVFKKIIEYHALLGEVPELTLPKDQALPYHFQCGPCIPDPLVILTPLT